MFGLFFVDKRKICASLTAKRLARFETTKAANFLKKFQVHSVLYGQGKYVFKREFLCFERFLHFDIGVKEKPQNVDLKLIFYHVLS